MSMTDSEARGFIQGKLDCMKKCGVFNKEDNINYNDCDYCNYCYSQGNFGQQKEAFNMAINALEKQIQKKVVKDGKWSYKCPCCGECAETDCGDAFYDYRLDYCNGCGQKLDWSDEE